MFSSSRREFLKHLGLAGATALGVPWTATGVPRRRGQGRSVTVSGRVSGPEGGLDGVSVTDGVTVVRTDSDGHFRFASSTRRPFVYLSVPSGYKLPTHDVGTAKFYQPLDPGNEDTVQAHFRLHPLERNDEQHAFAFLADPQAETEAEMQEFRDTTVPDVRQTAAALGTQPVFGVGGGDLVFDTLSLFSGYETAVQEMGIPFVQVVGNHDLNVSASADPGSTATFRRHFGPEYYSFDRGRVHYVVLDDVYWPGSDGFAYENDDYLGHIDATQLTWLEQDLEFVEDGRPVVVFTHIPPLSTAYDRRGESSPSVRNMIVNREALYELLDPFQAHIVTGHVHENEHRYERGPHEHVVGTACGAWWTGPICYDGTPRGYAVYEVRGESLQWRYKSTGQEASHQMRLYTPTTDGEDADRVLANVWGADDEWTITWYEDGIQVGAMDQCTRLDPLAKSLYAGEDQPDKHNWVEPQPTAHLFSAVLTSDANRIRVEATDRFGRTYSQEVGPKTESP